MGSQRYITINLEQKPSNKNSQQFVGRNPKTLSKENATMRILFQITIMNFLTIFYQF